VASRIARRARFTERESLIAEGPDPKGGSVLRSAIRPRSGRRVTAKNGLQVEADHMGGIKCFGQIIRHTNPDKGIVNTGEGQPTTDAGRQLYGATSSRFA
jgi:hypothetical protein